MKNFNITFKQHFLIESMLEDIEYSGNMEDDILMLHEIEYKLSKLKDNPYSINSKLFQNIFKRFYNVAYEIMENVSPELTEAFEKWSSLHQIEDAETWASMVYNELDEMGTGIEDIMTHGIHWGQLSLTPTEISKYADSEGAKEYIQEDLYNDPESYEYQIAEWLREIKNIEIEDEDVIEYFNDNDLVDEFYEYYIAEYFDPSDFSEMLTTTPESIKNAIEEELYPSYMNMYGAQLESIIEDIDEAVERLNEAETVEEDLGYSISGASDEELEGIAEKIYKSVAQMTTAISLALNVNHVNGNILEDYADISTDFMDDLNSYDVSQWDSEVNAILRR